jgi:hypothetical protein
MNLIMCDDQEDNERLDHVDGSNELWHLFSRAAGLCPSCSLCAATSRSASAS